jgi:hypothetical protein
VSIAALAFRGRRPGRRGSASAPPEPPPSGLTPNWSALPILSHPVSDWARVQSSTGSDGLAAGATWVDALTSVSTLKLTSATSPVANNGSAVDYASAGPVTSLTLDDGSFWVVVRVIEVSEGGRRWAFRVSRTGGIISAVPLVVQPARDLCCAHSRNPATPWFLYVARDDGRLHKIDLRTNTEVTGGVWPRLLSTSLGSVAWLSASADDTKFALCNSGGAMVVVWDVTPNTLTEYTNAFLTSGYSGWGFNEGVLSPSGRYFSARYNSSQNQRILDLVTGLLSEDYTPGALESAHVSVVLMPDGSEACVGLNASGDQPGTIVRVPLVPITAPNQALSISQVFTAQADQPQFIHTSSFATRAGGLGDQYTIGCYLFSDAVRLPIGAWAALGGGVFQASFLVSSVGAITTVRKFGVTPLTQRPDGTTSLNADEWSVDAPSGGVQVLRVRLPGDDSPVGRVSAASATNLPVDIRWTLVSGEVYEALVTHRASSYATRGIDDVWEQTIIAGTNGCGDAVRTLTRRANGTTTLGPNEWAVASQGSLTQLLRVRLQGGGDPTGRIVAVPLQKHGHYIAAAKLDGSELRGIVSAESAAHGASNYDLFYAGIQMPQIQQRDGQAVLWHTRHHRAIGRTDAMVSFLPLL